MRVNVAIRDRNSLQWWQGDGTWGSFTWLAADLDSPATTSTGWSFEFNGPPGSYIVGTQAVDGTNKWDQSAAWRGFFLESGPGTTTTTTTSSTTDHGFHDHDRLDHHHFIDEHDLDDEHDVEYHQHHHHHDLELHDL